VKAASVAGWLFGIARRVGLAARRHELRREKRERNAVPLPEQSARDWDELLRTVDQELEKLPAEERAALIACFLREQTQDEAARDLGWSLSTLRRRLERGKDLLRARLLRRGATLSSGLFAGILAPSGSAAVPRALAESAGRTAEASAVAKALAIKSSNGFVLAKMAFSIAALVAVVGATAASSRQEPAVEVPARPGIALLPPQPREAVTVTGRVVFPEHLPIPERRELRATDGIVKNADCCFEGGRRLFFENLLIEENNRGIANAVVWLQAGGSTKPPVAREHTIEVVDCQFCPRITIARAGDTLLFKNPAPLATNVKYEAGGKGLGSFNVLLAAKTGSVASPGPLVRSDSPDRFGSSIYPWMKGCVWTFDHPNAAVTDPNGRFTIPAMPSGECRLVIWHEELGYGPGGKNGTPIRIIDGPSDTLDVGTRLLAP
jgi:hypothetical protein